MPGAPARLWTMPNSPTRRPPPSEYELPNKPGALAECLDKLAAKGVNLNSICATVSKGGKKAVVVYTVAAEEKEATAA
jgi:hypothetical protein